tara:strand:+ start:951 stop:1475 length:525 start_codon:yes stop_codon:yes gene_type:complete
MNNQNFINFNFKQLKTTLSLYFFTLGTCLLGFSVYLFLESTNYSERSITSWSGQSLFWTLLIFFAALFLLFLPIEFLNSFKFINSSFGDLIANITFAILTSLFFLIFFQILLPSNTIILQEVISLTRAISFSGFIVIPILIFILNNLERRFSSIYKSNFSIVLLVWIFASQFFI